MKSKEFLAVCSKLIKDGKNLSNIQEYNNLYGQVNGILLPKLKHTVYPNAPFIQQEYEKLLDSIETALVIPELRECSVFSLYGDSLINIGKFFSGYIWETDVSMFKMLELNVPVLFVSTKSEDITVELINYLDKRLSLSLKEMQTVFEGYQQGVDIKKIVKYLVIYVPMLIDDVLFIYKETPELSSFVLEKIACCSEKKDMDQLSDMSFDVVVSSIEKENISDQSYYSKYVNLRNVKNYLEEKSGLVYQGYVERAEEIASQIEAYYFRETFKSEKIIKSITDDIVRIGNEQTETLKQLRADEKVYLEQLSRDKNILAESFARIKECIGAVAQYIDKKHNKGSLEGKLRISNNLLNIMFARFFNYIENGDVNRARLCLAGLYEVDKQAADYAEQYIDVVTGKSTGEKVLPPIDREEWYVIKSIIGISDVLKLSLDQVANNVERAKEHLCTGKEFYLCARVAYEDERNYWLQKSLDKGYELAGADLYEINKEVKNKDFEKQLLNAVVPEACMDYCGKHQIAFRKMAASKNYAPAIGVVVDFYFDKTFGKLQQIGKPKKGANTTNYDMKQEIGKTVITLCDYLISKKYELRHYKELKGETIFCLQGDYSEAMHCLSGISTDESNFCKAKMYEFGLGVLPDLSQALIHYRKIKDDRYKVTSAIRRVSEKLLKQQEEDEDEYDESENYSSSSDSYFVSDSYCFITTAACVALEAGDDCAELNMLRKFRDEHINDSKEGQELVLEYYRIAPSIVTKINELDNAKEIYLSLWYEYIKPSCSEIINENWNKAKCIYMEMVKKLAHRFGIQVDAEISKKYDI